MNTIQLLTIFAQEPDLFLLDSALHPSSTHSHSYLGFAPIDIIEGPSIKVLKKHQAKYPMVGVIGYEGQVRFGVYDTVIDIDHHTGRFNVVSFGSTAKARQLKDYVQAHLASPVVRKPVEPMKKIVLKPTMTQAHYERAVKHALRAIHDGDIYQINLTYALKASLASSLRVEHAINVYQHLRQTSPTHLCAFLKSGDGFMLSSSPERFCSLNKRQATLVPMKGTRPRGKNQAQDKKYYTELNQSPKEKAELLMVTDLARNDLGRVCQTGSVKVSRLRTIERYKKVFQATATVEGTLLKDKDIVDLLEATFPGGSVTGCPKLSAMGIIKQLETTPRGFYTGILGYCHLNQRCDFSMLIRTIFMKPKSIQLHVGSGIVADSNPRAEYQETLLKGQAMTDALIKGLTHG